MLEAGFDPTTAMPKGSAYLLDPVRLSGRGVKRSATATTEFYRLWANVL
jgi:hypothetical protein